MVDRVNAWSAASTCAGKLHQRSARAGSSVSDPACLKSTATKTDTDHDHVKPELESPVGTMFSAEDGLGEATHAAAEGHTPTSSMPQRHVLFSLESPSDVD